jgi:hypothetical protein
MESRAKFLTARLMRYSPGMVNAKSVQLFTQESITNASNRNVTLGRCGCPMEIARGALPTRFRATINNLVLFHYVESMRRYRKKVNVSNAPNTTSPLTTSLSAHLNQQFAQIPMKYCWMMELANSVASTSQIIFPQMTS